MIEKNNHIIEENLALDPGTELQLEGGQKGIIKLTPDMIMEIYCSFNGEGLGPIKWWKNK